MSKKTYLIHLPFPHVLDDKAIVPIGILFLETYLKSKEHDVYIVDLAGLTEDQWDIPTDGDIYGISAFTVDWPYARRVANVIKNKDNLVVLGGVHGTALPAECLNAAPIDVVVRGEGEHTLLDLVDGVPLEDIKGISYRSSDGVVHNPARLLEQNLDTFPFPRLEGIDYKSYRSRVFQTKNTERFWHEPSNHVITSRGCPNNCAFCSSAMIYERRVRYHSMPYLKVWLSYLCDLGFNNYYLMDEMIVVNKKRLTTLCSIFKERGSLWRGVSRVDCLDPETLKIMYDGGCRQLDIGIESGSQRLLDLVGKRITPKISADAIKMIHDAGIGVKGSFIVGLPTETQEDRDLTLEFIRQNPVEFVCYAVFQAFPGCPIWNDPERYGLNKDMFGGTNFGDFWTYGKGFGPMSSVYPAKHEETQKFMYDITELAASQDAASLGRLSKRDTHEENIPN